MPNGECAASLRVLVAMARADGRIHERERDVLDFLAKHALGMDVGEVGADAIDIEAECARIESDKMKRLTYSAAMIIADVDEERSPEETKLLGRIHAALGLHGVPEGPFVSVAHRARMAQITKRLTEANAEFFRAVAKSSQDGALDPNDYMRLLADLEAKKTALMESIFGG
jgi:tellurite resistance protein